ncbi:MAG: hypothetical protein ACPGOY_11610 [Rhodospirillaceae bacterium]
MTDKQFEALVKELDEFLGVLDHRIDLLRQAVKGLRKVKDRIPSFVDYGHVRELTSECLAFSIVIERRIDKLPEDKKDTVAIRFDKLTVAIWSTLLDGALKFLKAISEEEHLPLGSRDVFLMEIRTLYDAHKTLTSERYSGLVDDRVLHRRDSAERILNEIIDRAPRLLDLTGSGPGAPARQHPARQIA